MAFLQYKLRDLKAFYQYSNQLVSLLEERSDLLSENCSLYIAALSNVSNSCGQMGLYDEMRSNLAKLKKVKPNTKDDTLNIYRQYYNNYFSLCINTGAFTEGLNILEAHFKERKKLDKKQFEHSSFLFQYFYIYFGTGKYLEALDTLNEWLNLPRTVEYIDMQHLSKLLYLIVHYELNNHILLESLLRSTQRNLRKLQRYNTIEQLLIQCLRSVIQQPDSRKAQATFVKYAEKFQQLSISTKEKAAWRFFDISSWLESKATKRPFAQVIQERIVRT